jgi:hypothetical protein
VRIWALVAFVAGVAAAFGGGPSPVPTDRDGAVVALAGGCSGKRQLSEAEARALAAEVANRHLSGKTFRSAAGRPLTPPTIEPAFWLVVDKAAGRWRLSHDAPSGFYMAVSFALDGSDPLVERVGFADV